jgi:hypothetical protein
VNVIWIKTTLLGFQLKVEVVQDYPMI